jgi:alpha-glucosidase (family GH31 glycosyl hydrolase)
MIGGGELDSWSGRDVDQELFVRFTQVAALFPMMQFSLSPARVLDHAHLLAVRGAVDLHQSLVPRIAGLAEHAARTGEPILRALAYAYPGYDGVRDQFLLGDDLLCAPVLEKGATSRRVLVPAGRWVGGDGLVTVGPTETTVPVELDTIPMWTREG